MTNILKNPKAFEQEAELLLPEPLHTGVSATADQWCPWHCEIVYNSGTFSKVTVNSP